MTRARSQAGASCAQGASDFAAHLIAWQKCHGRHDLPWQRTRDPYRVWLSEIMLQQTQVAAVIPYYRRFLERFPTLADLAQAPVEAVMELWSGLGYYARARNLHRCAQVIRQTHGGEFPRHPEAIACLPGIGRSTANAIAAFCFAARVPILDGNVKRVLCRSYGIEGFPGTAAVEQRLWALAETVLPEDVRSIPIYIQAQMDLGATLCTRTRPACARCPLAGICVALREGRTAELPAPRPRKPLPQREVDVLLLYRGRRLLLERRPPAGIWGGLLSLPEVPPGVDAQGHAARICGCVIASLVPLPELRHGFTHFRLTLHPWSGAVQRNADASPCVPEAVSDPLVWVDFDDLTAAALPAPVRRIVAGFLRGPG